VNVFVTIHDGEFLYAYDWVGKTSQSGIDCVHTLAIMPIIRVTDRQTALDVRAHT
jgi:hypothetical protein